MNLPICDPLSNADTQDVVCSGLGITDLRADRGTVFEQVPNPKARLMKLRSVASAYGNWREGLPLDESYGAIALGWPLKVDLQPGFLLNSDSGLPSWEAERAVEGLLAGEARYIEMAAFILVEAKGCVLDLPGGVKVVLVRESDFWQSVKIDEPLLLLDGGESVSV